MSQLQSLASLLLTVAGLVPGTLAATEPAAPEPAPSAARSATGAVPVEGARAPAGTSWATLPELHRRLVEGRDGERQRFLGAVNAARKLHRLAPVRHDPTLQEPAQAYAEAVLAALRAGQPTKSVASLGSRITESWRDVGVLAAGGTGGSPVYSQRTPTKARPRLLVGEALILDGLDADEAVATALANPPSDLLEPGYARLAVGLAFAPDGPAPHVVWVACLLRQR